MKIHDILIMALYRYRVLAGDMLPSDQIMTLSTRDHAHNVEVALKMHGLWTHGDEHVVSWTAEKVEAEAHKHGLYSGELAIPRPGMTVGGVLPNFVMAGDFAPFPWGYTGVLYTAAKITRKRGRPRSLLSTKAKKMQRDAFVAKCKEAGITKESLKEMKRHHLMMLASEYGIHDPGYTGGTNEDLRKAIARKAKAR